MRDARGWKENTMRMLSRRQCLGTSGTVVGATMVPTMVLSPRAGAAEPQLTPKKLPFPPNDEFGSYEPTITPDGNTIYFARFAGSRDKRVLGTTAHIFVTHPVRAGALFTSTMENGVWQQSKRYESKLLDSMGLKCRLNAVARDGLVLGVVSVHDFGKFHTMVFVHYDPATKEWKGPIVEAPFNQPNVDGACPMFTAGGDKMIWSAGYDRGPGPVSTAGGTGSTYDLFWLKTSDIVAYYKAKTGLS